MISTCKDVNDLVVINYQRPTITKSFPDSKTYWLKFHDIVKNSEIEMWVNNAFWYIDDVLTTDDGEYMGGGFRYNFWVRTQEDKDKFLNLIDG
jgi:hypothetical protein